MNDVNTLYALIQEDPYILDNFDNIPFVETPLHAAVRDGNSDLAMEIIRLKPSFARKLNQDGFIPIHLALQSRQTQTVLQLIDIDPGLVRVKGREGITPLHCVSEQGDLNLLEKFLSACPRSLEDVTNKGETALHIALINDKVEAFQVLLRLPPWVGHEEARYCSKRIVNLKDRDGNCLLHIAVSKKQLQIVRCLLNCNVDINALNSDGLTPLDILLLDQTQSRSEEIEEMLRSAGALEATSLPIIDSFTHLLRTTDQRLNEAAQVGNVDALYALISEDVYLLDKIDQVPFIDTPLHIAASAGHIHFALEIMRLMPSFAKKQNQYGSSPMHLALQNKQNQMVLRLVSVERSLVRVQGKGGFTPLHYVAEKGSTYLLCKFLVACPESIHDVTIQKENALHIAAKNDEVEALEVLMRWLQYVRKDKILKQCNDEGNNLLHIAICRSHIQMVKLLINRVPKNVPNSVGMTALDILEDRIQGRPEYKELKSILRNAGAKKGSSSLANVKNTEHSLMKKVSWLERMALFNYRRKLYITNENREAVLVVAVLIATATYQAALSPSEFGDTIGGRKHFSDSEFGDTIGGRKHFSDSEFGVRSSDGRDDFGEVANYSDLDTWSHQIFLYLNVAAFYISMSVINHLLPYATARLVYPLIICFLSLMAVRSLLALICSILMLLVIWSPSFVSTISTHCCYFRRYKALRSIFKNY